MRAHHPSRQSDLAGGSPNAEILGLRLSGAVSVDLVGVASSITQKLSAETRNLCFFPTRT